MIRWIDLRTTKGTTAIEFAFDFVVLASSLYLTGGKELSAATIVEIKDIVLANVDVAGKVFYLMETKVQKGEL